MDSDVPWWQRAACQGMHATFDMATERGMAKSSAMRTAIDTCRECPVRQECLTDAMRLGDLEMIRGGLTPREIRKMLRARGHTISSLASMRGAASKRKVAS